VRGRSGDDVAVARLLDARPRVCWRSAALAGVYVGRAGLARAPVLALLAATARGVFVPGVALRDRSLFPAAAPSTAAVRSVSMANGRIRLPVLAMLLPLAGAGAPDVLTRRRWTGLLLGIGAGVGYRALHASTPPVALHGLVVVSSRHAGAAGWIAARSGVTSLEP
jgi:hypothetical protein